MAMVSITPLKLLKNYELSKISEWLKINKLSLKVSVTLRGVGMFMRSFEKRFKVYMYKVHINKFVIHIKILSQEYRILNKLGKMKI